MRVWLSSACRHRAQGWLQGKAYKGFTPQQGRAALIKQTQVVNSDINTLVNKTKGNKRAGEGHWVIVFIMFMIFFSHGFLF